MPLQEIASLYRVFNGPMSELDCGQKCAPYNERGVPFCCDIRHAVPAAYRAEWDYLKANSDLWHIWHADDPQEQAQLKEETPPGMVLLACLGHAHCQRDYRTMTCRSFPFFPYIDSEMRFIGLSYYWEYQDRCWVISHLDEVDPAYRQQFIEAYDRLFAVEPDELAAFAHHSQRMRTVFGGRRRTLPLLHRNGSAYKISPGSERLRRVSPQTFPKYGPYAIAALMPFPDEY